MLVILVKIPFPWNILQNIFCFLYQVSSVSLASEDPVDEDSVRNYYLGIADYFFTGFKAGNLTLIYHWKFAIVTDSIFSIFSNFHFRSWDEGEWQLKNWKISKLFPHGLAILASSQNIWGQGRPLWNNSKCSFQVKLEAEKAIFGLACKFAKTTTLFYEVFLRETFASNPFYIYVVLY